MITVCLEIDRAQAIARGIAAQGHRTFSLDQDMLGGLTLPERELLACAPSKEGEKWDPLPERFRLTRAYNLPSAKFRLVDPTIEGMFAALRAKTAELCALVDADRAEHEARVQAEEAAKLAASERGAFLREKGATWLVSRLPAWGNSETIDGVSYFRSDAPEIWDAAEKLRKEANERAEADRVAAAEAKKIFRRNRLEGVLVALGTPTQIARWLAGLCEEEEILDLWREQIFACLAEFPRYTKLEFSEIEHTDECAEPVYKSKVITATSLSDAQYSQLVKLCEVIDAADLGKVTLTVREHRIWCAGEGCSDSAVHARVGYLVEVETETGDTFSREYSLGD